MKLNYAGFHKLVEREEAGTTVRFEYNNEDELTAVVNEAGERYLFERDALGEVKSEAGFDGQRRVYFRDAASQVVKLLLPGNLRTELDYDAAGRVTEVRHFDGTTERYEYGLDGSLVRAANDESEVVFERDALGRVLSERVGEVVVTSQYGPVGARPLVESSLGARQAVLYDALGEVESLHHGPVSAFWRSELRFGRDPLGTELSRELPGGIQVSWSRDASGKPTSRRTMHSQPGARPLELNARGYQWRGEDQIAAIVDAAQGPRWFDHDGRGRLIRERRPDVSSFHGDQVLHRAMDAVGNIYRSPDLSDRRYGPGGRIEEADSTRYEHDALGNLIRKTEPDGSQWRYLWNGAGMLREVIRPDGKHVGFEYDVFARRTKKVVFTSAESSPEGLADSGPHQRSDSPRNIESETRFVWDGHTVLHELSSEEGLTTWYWEPGTFTPVTKERGKQLWSLVHDHLGTPTEMYDEQGTFVWQMELDTCGKPTFEVGTAKDCPWRWPGQYEDEETSYCYNRWRYWDGVSGVYISTDPSGFRFRFGFTNYVSDTLTMSDPFGLADFWSVQGPTSARRLRAGGEPWPTGLQRANLGPGYYSWATEGEALNYRSLLESHGRENLEIMRFSIPDEQLASLRALDLRLLSDAEVDAWMDIHSHYGQALPHDYDYVIRTTGIGDEHYFSPRAFGQMTCS